MGGLFGVAGRQQDRSHYRVYFQYEYSMTLFVSLLFALMMVRVLAEVSKTFD